MQKPPQRVGVPLSEIDHDKTGRDAISQYDTNGDGALSEAELARLSGVLGALARIHPQILVTRLS